MYWATDIKTGVKERSPGILPIPCSVMWRPNVVAHGEGKGDAPAGDGMKNPASCMERQSDECRSQVEHQCEGHRGSV